MVKVTDLDTAIPDDRLNLSVGLDSVMVRNCSIKRIGLHYLRAADEAVGRGPKHPRQRCDINFLGAQFIQKTLEVRGELQQHLARCHSIDFGSRLARGPSRSLLRYLNPLCGCGGKYKEDIFRTGWPAGHVAIGVLDFGANFGILQDTRERFERVQPQLA